MNMGSDDILAPGQPVAPPAPYLSIQGTSLDLGGFVQPDGTPAIIVTIRNPVAAAQIALTPAGLDELIAKMQAARPSPLAMPPAGLVDPNGRRL